LADEEGDDEALSAALRAWAQQRGAEDVVFSVQTATPAVQRCFDAVAAAYAATDGSDRRAKRARTPDLLQLKQQPVQALFRRARRSISRQAPSALCLQLAPRRSTAHHRLALPRGELGDGGGQGTAREALSHRGTRLAQQGVSRLKLRRV